MATVIELTRTTLRWLQAEGSGKSVKVRQFLVEPLPSMQIAAERLGMLARRVKSDSGTLILMMPREQVITRILKFPTVRPEELARMVELSGKAQLPFPREQAVADFQIIEQSQGSTTVQLVACHRQLVDQYIALLRQVGLDPSLIVPSSWGAFAWYLQLGRGADAKEPVMVVNVDGDHTDLALVHEGKLLFSRSLSQGLIEWQAGAESLAMLAQEIERSVSGLRKELPGVDAATLLLTGLGPLEAWRAGLSQQLGKPVVVRQATTREAPTSTASIIGTLGVAMAEPKSLVSLLPRDARKAQDVRRQSRQLVTTGLLFAIVLGLGVLTLTLSVRRQRQVTQNLVARMHTLERTTRQTEHQEQELGVIERALKQRQRLAELLVHVMQLAPADIMLDSLSVEQPRRELVLRGNGPSTRQVLELIRGLEESGRYERVELRYSSRRNRASGPRVEFEIVAKLLDT